MSNLLKFNSVIIHDQNKLVIDSNSVVDRIIDERRKLLMENEKSNTESEDGFVCGIEAATVEQLISDEESLAEVHHEIDMEEIKRLEEEILADAHNEANQIKEEARQSGYNDGYNDGVAKAEAEYMQKCSELEADFARRKAELDEEYKALKEKMEPELVETLIEVFSKVTHTIADSKKDMVAVLANNVLKNTEMSKSYLIKVSEEDYGFVAANTDMIVQGVAKDVKIDVCIDFQLKRNQCIIETDLGVFDCSLDIQLNNLISDIKLLSCTES